MFDSLKNKLKGLFKKTPEKLEETVYEAPSVPETREEPPVEPRTEIATEPETARAEEPSKISRRDRVKAEKEQRKASSSPVGDSGKRIRDKELESVLDELEVILFEADVAFSVAEEIKDGVRKNLTGKKYSRQYSLDEIVEMAVRDAVHNVLKVNEFDFDAWIEGGPRPAIIMFVGINGTGKTTAIAKVANRLQKRDMTVVLAACDTFRAGAIEQLTIHADRLGAKIVKHAQDADPAAVAYDAIEHARSKRRDAVLIDTAGRMQTNSNLIEEMKKVARIAKPDLKVFVGDSLAGNDAIEQAKVFDAAIGIDAIILTKIDTDAKGGAALSIAHTIGKPIAFVCDGQGYEDIQKFSAEWMLNRLFD
ncbi:MAG: signal recognition particle-docking protein FtsY [Candidatus Methanomethylophilaceae archaeon]